MGRIARAAVRHEATLSVCAVLLLAIAILKPALDTGWFGDDAFSSMIPAAVDDGRLTWWQIATSTYHAWLVGNGRWYPTLVALKFGTFALVHDRWVYKLLLLVLSLVALEVARRLIAELWGSRFALLALLFAVVCVQVRGYHDPFLAYHGIIQVESICWCASLWAFAVALRTGDRRLIALSIACWVFACSLYEIAYLMAPLFFVIARLRHPWPAALRLTAPYAVCGAGFILAATWLRAQARISADNMYAIRPDVHGYLGALGDQLVAALPASYLILATPPVEAPWWHGFGSHVNVWTLLAAGVVAYVVVRERDQPATVPAGAALFGGLLVVIPALELPALAKYQHELHLGIGYLPVFIEYIGCGIVFAALVAVGLTRHWQRIAVAAAAAILIGASAASSDLLAADLQVPYLVSRDTFERDVRAGLLGPVPAHAALAIEPEFPWVCHDGGCIDGVGTPDLVRHLARKELLIVGPADAAYVARFDAHAKSWSLTRVPATSQSRPARGNRVRGAA